MKKIQYTQGQLFHRVTFLERLPNQEKAKFKCFCNKIFTCSLSRIKTGKTKSCGCLRDKAVGDRMRTHGFSQTKLYKLWKGVTKRCYNPNDKYYHRYGGRGIAVQDNWRKDFKAFYDYVSKLPNYDESKLGIRGLTIDRKDTDGNYCEGNIMWSNPTMQCRNRNMQKNNTSGFVGVSFIKHMDKFLAYIAVNKKRINIGYHKDPAQAYELRKAYIVKHKLKGFKL